MDAKSNRLKLKKAWLLWAAMPFLLSAFRCGDDEQVEYVEMAFILPFSMGPSPGKLINGTDMKKGDTLWLDIDFSDSLLEFHSGRRYKVKGLDFKFAIAIFNLLYPEKFIVEQRSATADFDFVQKKGEVTFIGETFSDLLFEYSQDRYRFNLGLIPKRTGIYFFTFVPGDYYYYSDYPNRDFLNNYVIGLEESESGVRRVAAYDAFLVTVNEGSNNRNLAKAYNNQFAEIMTFDSVARYKPYVTVSGSYTIRVVE